MLKAIAKAKVSDIHLRRPVQVGPDDKLLDVVVQMREFRRGAAIVEDGDGRIIGIFTERDLMLRVGHDSHDWHGRTVAEVMTKSPTALAATDSLSSALRQMKAGGFRHLPVVDNDRRTAGILSIRDVLSHLVEYFPAEFINLPPDSDHEAKKPWGG